MTRQTTVLIELLSGRLLTAHVGGSVSTGGSCSDFWTHPQLLRCSGWLTSWAHEQQNPRGNMSTTWLQLQHVW